MKNKIFLVIYSKKMKRTFTKYFSTEWKKDKYKRKIPFINDFILIEDSSDINYGILDDIMFYEHDEPDYLGKYDSSI